MKLSSIVLCICGAFLVQVKFQYIFFHRIAFNPWIFFSFQTCSILERSSFAYSFEKFVYYLEDVNERFKYDLFAINNDNFYVEFVLDEFVSVLFWFIGVVYYYNVPYIAALGW